MANHRSRGANQTHMHSLRDLIRFPNMDCRLYLVTVYLIFILPPFVSCNAQWSNLAANQNVVASELDGLIAFQKAADGNGVLRQNWTGNKYCTSWRGVKCDLKTNLVSHIFLFNTGLKGTVPENTLGNLTGLQYLDVANNTLSGSLPTDLKNLNNLVHFQANDNQFSGPFPNLPTTSKINVLDLSFNRLSGQINPDLTGLTNLSSLNLSTNQFSGGVPLLPSSLKLLKMTDNNLTQVSPEEYSTFQNAFLGNTNLCVGNVTYCASVNNSASVPVPSPSSNPMESGKKGPNAMSIVFITVGSILALVVILGYGRYFYLTRFETPGGAFYHYNHPEDVKKSPDKRRPSPPANKK